MLSDLRHSLREFRKRPALTATAVLSPSPSASAPPPPSSPSSTPSWSNPYPYRDANRLTIIHLLDPQGNERITGYSGPEIAQLRQLKSFESVVALQQANPTTTDGDLPEDVRCLLDFSERTKSFRRLTNPRPLAHSVRRSSGTGIRKRRRPQLPLLERYFLGNPNVLGRTIRLDHIPYQVVGVMPPATLPGLKPDVYRPLTSTQIPTPDRPSRSASAPTSPQRKLTPNCNRSSNIWSNAPLISLGNFA